MSSETFAPGQNKERTPSILLQAQPVSLFTQLQAQPVSLAKAAPVLSKPKAKSRGSKGYFLRIKEHNVTKLQSLAIRRFNENLIPSPSITELAKYLLFKDLREASSNSPANPKNAINNQLSDSPMTRST